MGFNDAKSPIIWRFSQESKADRIPPDIISPKSISNSQRNSAKKAIIWLLFKAPHSEKEIADHFDLSPELVKVLVEELVTSGNLIGNGRTLRFRSLNREQSSEKKMNRTNTTEVGDALTELEKQIRLAFFREI